MSLLGKAAVAMWWNIPPDQRSEFGDWHSHEHFPERMSIPGFKRGSRWASTLDAEGFFVLYELFDAAAEERSAHVTVVGEQQVLVKGDRDLLFDAAANLVDNAVKHGREAGLVTVEVARRDNVAVLSIADDGPGIPVDEREHVLKRFYRLEQSRSSPGNGLGLSLVAAVARLHGARIEMLDNAPGLKFRLWFPGPATARGEAKCEPRSAAET